MSWKRSEEVQPGDWVRDVGSVTFVAPPDRHGTVELVARQPGGCDQSVTLGVGGVVEVEPPFPGTA